MTPSAPTILVVDDNPDHAMLIRLAIRMEFPELAVGVVHNGHDAVGYLSEMPPFEDRELNPDPTLVLLDLIMPGMDGFGVLEWAGTRADRSVPPIVVLTSSVNPGDEARALELGADAYYTKPSDLDELKGIVRAIVERWLR